MKPNTVLVNTPATVAARYVADRANDRRASCNQSADARVREATAFAERTGATVRRTYDKVNDVATAAPAGEPNR
jgi:hypothetical protein